MSLPRPALFTLRSALAGALAGILYLATAEQGPEALENVNDKTAHVLAFGALALLADFSFPEGRFGARKFLWLLGYGALIEFLQYFLPYRTASALDLLADAAGLALYWACHGALKGVPLLRRRWE